MAHAEFVGLVWRGVRVTALLLFVAGAAQAGAPWEAGFEPLVGAESIARWQLAGESPAEYRFEDGVVVGQPIGHSPKNAFLCSPRTYHDFELRFAFRIQPRSLNSGVQFRSRVRDDGIVAGPQLEMEVQPLSEVPFFRRFVFPMLVRLTTHPWRPRYWAAGGIYGENLDMGWIFPGVAGGDAATFQAQGERLTNPDGWNELRLEAFGPRVRTWLAGEPRADFEHEPTNTPG